MAEKPRERATLAAQLGVAAATAVIGFGAVYVMMRQPGNESPPPSPVVELSAQSARNPLSVGDMAAFVFKPEPATMPQFTFVDQAEKPVSLKDWTGRVVLLNLWATWCAPCRKEMPGLDRLQKQFGGDAFEVVALSVDKTGIEGARRFFDQIKIENLKVYADPTAKATAILAAVGMPTTLLMGRDGREVGRLVGPAEWDSPDAIRLVTSVLGEKASN